MPSVPRVSLVTPAYNQADFLAETMDSVLAQTYDSFEYLVVDDGSVDATAAVLQRYAGRVDFRSQRNRGQAQTLNEAWGAARGEYLGYLSSDDLLLPQALERLVAVLDEHPDVVCVYPDSDLIDVKSRRIRRNVCRPFDLAHVVVMQECHVGPGALFRRSAFLKLGGWRPYLKLAPDREFWMRLGLLGEIRMLDETLAQYRTHGEATSFRAATAEITREYLRVLDEYFARPDIPAILIARRSEAYARAWLLMARNALWRGDWRQAAGFLEEAVTLHPPLDTWRERALLLRQGLSKPVKQAYSWMRRVGRR